MVLRVAYSQRPVKGSRAKAPELFSTRQVAEMLGIEMWRVKNFSEGEAFRLPPTMLVGKGRGSRRLYDRRDVYRILIAHEMTMLGFTPQAVGAAIREIAESRLVPNEGADSLTLVMERGGKWHVAPGGRRRDAAIMIPFQRIIGELEYALAHPPIEYEERG